MEDDVQKCNAESLKELAYSLIYSGLPGAAYTILKLIDEKGEDTDCEIWKNFVQNLISANCVSS